MIILKAIWKAIRIVFLLPILLVLKIAEWICSLAQTLSGWLFRLLGLLMLAAAIASWVLQIEGPPEVIRMLIGGTVIFLLPMIGEFIIAGIMLIEFPIKQAIKN